MAATENEIFLSQVRDVVGTTLDVILANLQAQTAISNSAANTCSVSANDGSTLTSVGLNFVNTANITIVVTPDSNAPGNANVAIFGLGGAPGGANTQVQFANNGTFGGSPNLTFNSTSNTLSLVGPFILNGVNVGAELAAAYAAANLAITKDGSVITSNAGNIQFLSTSTINVSGSQAGGVTNVSFSVNTTSVSANAGVIVDYSAVATTNQNAFTMSANASAASYAIVTINGLLQLPGTDYTLVNNALTFTSNCVLNDVIDARIFTTGASVIGSGAAGANTWVQFNDSGQLGAVSNLSYNKATNTLNIGGPNANLIVNGINVVNVLLAAYASANLGQNTVAVSANGLNTLLQNQLNFNNTISTQVQVQSVGNGNANISFLSQVALIVPMSSLTGNLAAGQAVAYLRSPKAFTLTNVSASVYSSSTSGNVAVQIRQNGQNVLTNLITINANSNTSLAAAQQPSFANANTGVALNDLFLFDIVSPGVNAAGLMVTLLGIG